MINALIWRLRKSKNLTPSLRRQSLESVTTVSLFVQDFVTGFGDAIIISFDFGLHQYFALCRIKWAVNKDRKYNFWIIFSGIGLIFHSCRPLAINHSDLLTLVHSVPEFVVEKVEGHGQVVGQVFFFDNLAMGESGKNQSSLTKFPLKIAKIETFLGVDFVCQKFWYKSSFFLTKVFCK